MQSRLAILWGKFCRRQMQNATIRSKLKHPSWRPQKCKNKIYRHCLVKLSINRYFLATCIELPINFMHIFFQVRFRRSPSVVRRTRWQSHSTVRRQQIGHLRRVSQKHRSHSRIRRQSSHCLEQSRPSWSSRIDASLRRIDVVHCKSHQRPGMS